MGIWASLLGRELPPTTVDAAPAPVAARHRFAVGDDFATWSALVGGTTLAGRVSRVEASRVPAIQRARNLICSTIASLPLHAINAAGEQVEQTLLVQPERLAGLVRSVTIARTVEDLLYDGASLWLVVTRTSTRFPESVQRVQYGQWSQDADTGTIRVDGREVDPLDAITFTSSSDPLLVAGANAIRALIRLEATASLYIDTPEPSTYFTAADGIDPADDEEITRLLADWQAARKARAVAFVPSGVQLNSVKRMTAEELQLIEARRFSITEIARLTGIDPTWLSVDVSTRTYSNIQDERRAFIDFTLSPYLRAVEERLSLGDCTPRGQRVRFNLDGFLRASTTERYAAHATALSAGFLTLDEVRALEDRPPLPGGDQPTGDNTDDA